MTKKILKICEKPLITSECFTYYKMSIIQTIPNYESWLINRFKLFIDEDGDPRFGENGLIYTLTSYSEMLNIEDGHIFRVKPDEIISYIIQNIDSGKYVIIDLNFVKLYSDNDGFNLHETLIYGYDCDSQEFVIRELHNGVFKEEKVSFQKVEEAYSDVYDFFNSDKLQLLNRKRFFTGITLLSPRYDYNNVNDDYDLVIRLESELAGNIYKRYDSNGENEAVNYTGITCVKKLHDELLDILSKENYDRERIKNCRRLCLKLSERENVLLHAVRAFVKKYNINDDNDVVTQFSQCYNMMYQNVLLFYKYLESPNTNIIKRITDRIETVYYMEKRVLESITALIRQNYDSICSLKD